MSDPRARSHRRSRSGTRKRPNALLEGPLREVIYIFEREGVRGGAIWWLVLSCGHSVARKRHVAKTWTAQVHMLFRPIEEKLAPKRVQCHFCGSGSPPQDPWLLIKAFGGPDV